MIYINVFKDIFYYHIMAFGSQNAKFKKRSSNIRVYSMRKGARRRYRAIRYKRKLMNLTQQVIPIIGFKKLRYHDTMALNLINTFQAQKKYSLNGLYDPDITGIGHQPLGFDQMMGLYNKYCVLGAKVTILGRPGSTSNSYPMNLVVEQSQLSSLSYQSASQAWEKNTCKIVTFNSSYQDVYVPQQKLGLNFSAKKTFRARDRNQLISVDHYNGDSSSNPDQQQFMYVTYLGQGDQQTTASLYVDVTIEYIVAFHDRKNILQS